ncbi:FMN-dependent dehydrogenase [Xylogone sp. PMI_703]|nr:FMN-dependent dehydrogenase [Xylogone sp. PMI_703]
MDAPVMDVYQASLRFRRHQFDIYANGMLRNQLPTITTDPNKLEQQAHEAMETKAFNFIYGGAGEHATMDDNRRAFKEWKFIPKMLVDANQRDLSIKLFGTQYSSPVLFAPIGAHGVYHSDGEIGVAEVAAELDIPYIHSTAATASIEEAANANGNGPRWYQLYWPQDNNITASLIRRASDNGYAVLVVTVDTWTLGWRPANLDGGFVPFIKGRGNQTGFSDPIFRKQFKEKYGVEVEDNIMAAASEWNADIFSGRPHTWEKLEYIRSLWKGPIVIKGIQHVDDAIRAAELGMQGIVVSNHGGRQVDGAIGSLNVLPEIVEAVGDKMTVLFDSGVRTGADILKALCLGAKAVLIGRPYVYGLGINGKQGAKDVMMGLLADLDVTMGLVGLRSISECNQKVMRRMVTRS